MNDEDVIARASSGLALRGIYVGGASDGHIGSRQASKQLLRPLEGCKLMGPDEPTRTESLYFSCIQASEGFCEAVHKSGWSVAVNLGISGLFGLSSTAGTDEVNVKMNSYDRKTTEACHLQYWYVPKAAFKICCAQMQLSDEALEDMSRISTVDEAKTFLLHYNSHISTGTYHLGGILMKRVTLKSGSETTFQSMLDMVSTKANAKAEVDYLTVKSGMNFGYLDEDSSSSSNRRSRQRVILKSVHMALGPATDDEDEFKKKLEDRSTWYIIDTKDGGELVPVWEIPSVKRNEGLRKARNRLRDAWQTAVESVCPRNGRLFNLLQDSYRVSSSSPNLQDPQLQTLEDRKLEVKRLLDLFLDGESKASEETHEILSELWVAASKKIDRQNSVSWNERLRLFQSPPFQLRLNKIAESPDGQMKKAKDLIVRGILNSDMRRCLKNADVSLSASLQKLLQISEGRNEVTYRLPNFDQLSATQLLERLRNLDADDSNALQTRSSSNMVIPVEAAIKACLRGQSRDSKTVKAVVTKNGFDENGIFVGKFFNSDILRIIIQELGDELGTPAGILSLTHLSHVPESLKTIVPAYTSPPKNEFTYGGDFLVDRPNKGSCEDPRKRMMDCLRHRVQPFGTTLNTAQDGSTITNEDDDFDMYFGPSSSSIDEEIFDDGTASSYPSPEYSPLEILVNLLVRSDSLAQIAVFQLLLEERFAIPLVVPLDHALPTREGSSEFGHLVEALRFVKVKLANEVNLSISENTELPRVVFVSNRVNACKRQLAEMVCEVTNCQFPNCNFFKHESGPTGPTILELGVGFLETARDQSRKHMPCLVFCVSGDHDKLGKILENIADVVVIETEPDEEPSIPSWTTPQIFKLFWSTDSKKSHGKNGNKFFCHMWGSFKQISQSISKYLVSAIRSKNLKGSNGGAASLDECLKSLALLTPKTLTSDTCMEHNAIQFDSARASFSLQNSYNEEARYYFEALENKGKKATFEREMKKCQRKRATEAKSIQDLPILQSFVKLLIEEDYVKRNIGILHFQLTIDQKLQSTLEDAAKKENQAFEDYQMNPELKNAYYRAKEEHVDQMLGLEHLWRELSHIFVADPKREAHLPRLAAYHLMDGFPLEILDGDAANFHKLWVDTVLVELDNVLQAILQHKPKVFVLSVVGLQSSGKSTLLNVMFGAKLKASAGMCTRGVYIQLVKSELPEFDYVLILDTMGLKAPEYFGRKGAVAQDNRLATFAVLPADACVVMVANEEDNGLKEVLPMVMLAFRGSTLAEKTFGRMKAKLFFVYRSVDINDVKKLRNNQRKLKEDLQDASLAVGKLNIGGTSNQENTMPNKLSGVSPLQDFQINPIDEKRSDVKYFGNLKKGTTPPEDVPDWEYGSKVKELREYIHERVLDEGRWVAPELMKWKDYLGMVWESITDANFELSFLNRIEHANFNDIRTKLAVCRQKVGKKWQIEFENLTFTEGLEVADKKTDQPLPNLWKTLKSKVEDTIKDVEEEVRNILDEEKYQNWKVRETEGWDQFYVENERNWKEQLRNWMDGAFGFDKLVREYTTKMEVEMAYVRERHYDPDRDQKKMEEDFASIFERVLKDAADKHPAMAMKVQGMIHEKYLNDAVVGQKFKFEDNLDKNILTKWLEEMAALKSNFVKVLQFWKSGNDGENSVESMRRKLIAKLGSCLQDAKQYSGHIVDEMMEFTERLIEFEPRAQGQDMHTLVKALLTERMTEIQEDWDTHHNVSKKLKDQRGYFQQCFENHARKENGTKMLSTAFCNVLGEDHLVHAFIALVTKIVANKLQSEQHWVCNWRVMRAHLDLHLIGLIEEGKRKTVVEYVSNGQQHYKTVVKELTIREINKEPKEDVWKKLVGGIRDAMNTAAIAAGSSKSGKPKSQVFQESIITSLSSISPELAKNVSTNVSKKLCEEYGNDIDFYGICDQVSKQIGDTHVPDMTLPSDMDSMACSVRERMSKSNVDSARERCDEMCPRCHLTCFMATCHAGKHHTLHQPQGLNGVCDFDTKELSPWSCSKSVELNQRMRGSDIPQEVGFVPYRDFEKYFPSWTLPSDGPLGTVEVREYIFAHFQEEIVQQHKRWHIVVCPDIPPGFKHDLKTLRLRLENDIQSYTGLPYN